MSVPALFIGAGVVGAIWVASKSKTPSNATAQQTASDLGMPPQNTGVTVPGGETAVVTDPNTLQQSFVSDAPAATDGTQQVLTPADTGALTPTDNSSGSQPSGATNNPPTSPQSAGVAGATQVGGQVHLPNPNAPQQTAPAPTPMVTAVAPDAAFNLQYGGYNKTYQGAFYQNRPDIVI